MLNINKPLPLYEVHDAMNTDIIIALCQLYSKPQLGKIARANVTKLCDELGRRNVVDWEDFETEYMQAFKF